MPVAVYARTNSGNTVYYLLADHQGSVASITNGSGTEVVGESFDAFGNRRNPTTWSGPPSNTDLTTIAGITRQGYTFQTALGLWMGMNHMNGRVEDSVTGRMLSADPYIPDPTNTQSYNRYSYVNNNPLTLVDPSGFDSCDGSDEVECQNAGPDPDPGLLLGPSLNTGMPRVDIYGDRQTFYYAGPLWDYQIPSPMPGGGLGVGAGAGQPQQPSLQQIVVAASRRLPINFKLPDYEEQMWVIDAEGNIIPVVTVVTKLHCSDGSTAGASHPADPNFNIHLYVAVIHTHPFWSLPFPGPFDAVIPRSFGIPNFGISPSGVWVVNPGSSLTVSILSGSWGTGPNRERFDASTFAKRINAPGSGGKAAQCH